jgi:predicted NUDIX family NTP pyrophosphohydrolase
MARSQRPNLSAGVLLFRRCNGGEPEIFLAHPGGPFWASRELGAWTIPKGVPENGEELLETARREFREETGLELSGPFWPLGTVLQKAGKTVHAWACEGDADAEAARSNVVRCEWPPRSGVWIEVPEVDRCAWFDPVTARERINQAQVAFIDRLESWLQSGVAPGA